VAGRRVQTARKARDDDCVKASEPARVEHETRESWRTSLGPALARRGNRFYVLRAANDGEFRAGEQFLGMMRAHSLDQWKDAMRVRARINSSFTYADRAGHIYCPGATPRSRDARFAAITPGKRPERGAKTAPRPLARARPDAMI
jgi:acyl-homoserine lactone acylase PvdQ